MEEMECNPEHCPYAKGHYDRINEAIFDLIYLSPFIALAIKIESKGEYL